MPQSADLFSLLPNHYGHGKSRNGDPGTPYDIVFIIIWTVRARENHRLVHREEWDQLVHRENEGFLHSKLHHAEFENKKAIAHAAGAVGAAPPFPAVPSKQVETMKSVANPLLSAKAAAPILIQKQDSANQAPVQPVKNVEPVIAQSAVKSDSVGNIANEPVVEKAPSVAPKSNFPSIKIDISLSEEEIEKEMERIKVGSGGFDVALDFNFNFRLIPNTCPLEK